MAAVAWPTDDGQMFPRTTVAAIMIKFKNRTKS